LDREPHTIVCLGQHQSTLHRAYHSSAGAQL
jgi:hypothetical protein